MNRLLSIFFLLQFSLIGNLLAQDPGSELDSLRKMEEEDVDSVIFTSKYIRYTDRQLLKTASQTVPIDTTLTNFQNYSPLYQSKRPTIGLGSLGIAYRDLLFTPSKTIGFDPGFHALDYYLMTQDDVKYYRARSPYTDLYYVNGGFQEQVFKATHSQNIKPNWNFGANYNRIGAEGFYTNQDADHLNAALFTWYESPGKRYNLLANALFNTIKAGENGSTTNDTIFTGNSSLRKDAEIVRLSALESKRPRQTWRQTGFLLKQMYYIGRMDSLKMDSLASQILPTQRVSHSVNYSMNRYKFFRDEPDLLGALPDISVPDSLYTNDSTIVNNLSNEFTYSFYLRGKTVSFLKNEVKLDLGLQHDLYHYEQKSYTDDFHNITLKAGLGYRFSDKVNIQADLQQIAQGRNAGDFFYLANTSFLLSNSLGRIVLGAYSQNKSPEQMFERADYQFHSWDLNFDRTKVNNLFFVYENPKLQFSGKAEYSLIDNYLYYRETDIDRQIEPAQFDNTINLLKISIGKDFRFGNLHFDNYVVYQKTDQQDLLRTPELYTYSSLYYALNLFNALSTNFGLDVRYNTPFISPAYSINTSQFYNDREPVEFAADPIVDLWIRANLRRSTLFLKYDYANQGLFSNGFYTVKRYPMQDALLKFGLSWKFYN